MLLFLLLAASQIIAQTSVVELLEREAIAQLRDLDAKTEGALGVAAIDLSTRRSWNYHGDTVFPQASSIKIPILIRMFADMAEGRFQLSDPVTLEAKDAVGGSGHLREQLAKNKITLTVKEVITAMMETSDNTATNQCIRMVGMHSVNRMLDHSESLPRTPTPARDHGSRMALGYDTRGAGISSAVGPPVGS